MSHSPGTVTPVPPPLEAPRVPISPPFLQEDTALALQRLMELTAPRVTPLRSLRAQYRLIRKLGSGCYGRVLLARPRPRGEFQPIGATEEQSRLIGVGVGVQSTSLF